MNHTRVDTQALSAALAKLEAALDEVEGQAALLPMLTEEERAAIPRPPTQFPPAGRQFAQAMQKHEAVATAAGFDPAAVIEDLDNVGALSPVMARVERLQQRFADSRLRWLGEAYAQCLPAYGASKVLAARTNDGELQAALSPLADLFKSRR